MTPYIILLVFISLWISVEKAAIHRKSFWIPLLILSVFSGIRNYTVGTDSPNYTKYFRYNLNPYNFSFNENVEYGYQLFTYILLNLTHNYFWLFFISSLIVVGCYLVSIRKLSVNYTLSVFIFITLGTYTFFFNGLRQGIAMALIALATPALISKQLIPFLLIVILASSFHISALVLLPVYLLLHSKIQNYYKFLISFLTSMIGSQLVIGYLAEDNIRYQGYTQESEKSGGLVTLGFYSIIMIALQIIKYFYKIKNQKFEILLTYYSIGIFLLVPIALVGTNPSGPQRILFYFTWSLALLVPMALKRINNLFIYILTVIFCLTYFLLTTTRFSNLTPYTINPLFKIF
ncbi:EpsG family protein [Psychrobacter sp. SHUES1]|uniref:EpsG family protein n=1 Tax=Psychrobacter sp. SHUES1 TaxID=1849383 RepID=UPI0007F54227|nr:EpsG family protein [Psychrobacter sp. SHUES1]OAP71941.1 hypothetical protein A7325_09845 [Psychrobacter sp. SHUES1]